MSLRFVLWRVVLCLGLVLNGSVVASPSMLMPQPMRTVDAVAAGTITPSRHPACHEQAAGAERDVGRHHTPSGALPANGKHGTPECCTAGSCSCACMQPPVTLAVDRFSRPAMRDMVASHARARHDEPALPHLIRPPIGQAFDASIRRAMPCARVIA